MSSKKVAVRRGLVWVPPPAAPPALPSVKTEPGTTAHTTSDKTPAALEDTASLMRSLMQLRKAALTTSLDAPMANGKAMQESSTASTAHPSEDDAKKIQRAKDATPKMIAQYDAKRDALREGLDPMSEALKLAKSNKLLNDDEHKYVAMLVGVIKNYLMQALSNRMQMNMREKKFAFASDSQVRCTIEGECSARNAIGIDNLIERIQLAVGAMPDDPELAEKRRLVLPQNSSHVHKRVKLMHAATAAADTDGVQRILDRHDAKKEEIRASLDSVFALLHPVARDQLLDDASYKTMKETADAMFYTLYRAEAKRVVADCGQFTSQWETLTETQRRRYATIAKIAASAGTINLLNM
jgi:hypothetical protein